MAEIDGKLTMERFQCDICSKTYPYKSSLQRHIKTHDGEKPHVCETCGKTFSFKYCLDEHKICHSRKHQYLCPDCGKSFKHRQSMNRHVIIHKEEKLLKCEVCEKSFTSAYLLKRHQRSHEDRAKCGRCNRQMLHLDVHRCPSAARQKTLQCKFCHRKFLERRFLVEHFNCVHSFTTKYKCNSWKKEFRHRGSLHHHKNKSKN